VARVLLIDDDIAEICAVKRVLSRGGHQAILATSIADAITLAEQERPAVAVLSAACENGGGVALARRLVEDPDGRRLPILVLGREDEVPAGAVRVPLPLDPSRLEQELRIALGKTGAKPVARVPLTALPGGSAVAGSPSPAAQPSSGRSAAAAALEKRAAELRRERVEIAEWLEPPRAGRDAPPAPALAGATEADLPPALQEERRDADEDRLVAEIDAELDRLTRDDADEHRGDEPSAEELADEIARRAEEEADRRRAEAEAERLAVEAQLAEEEARRRSEEATATRGQEAERDEAGAAESAPLDARLAVEPEPSATVGPLGVDASQDHAPAATTAAQDVVPAVEEDAEEEARRLAVGDSVHLAEQSSRLAQEERLAAEAGARQLAEELAREREEAVERAAEGEEGARVDFEEGSQARPAPEEKARRRARETAKLRGTGPEAPVEPLAPPREMKDVEPAPEPSAEPRGLPEQELPPPPAEVVAGTLSEAPMPRLLALAARGRLTGRLDFGSSTPRSLYFEDGRVVGATSGSPQERAEEVALRLGLLTREQHRQVVGPASGLSPRRTALLLLERGFVKPEELTPLVRRRTEEVVFALFGEVAVPFRYAPARVPPEERIALGRGPLALALDGVRRKWVDPRLGSVLGGPGTLLAPAPHAPGPSELGLSQGEEQVRALADGLRTLDEIVEGSPLGPLPTRQVLAGLVMVGALASRFHGRDSRESGGRAIDLARLRDKLDQVRRADYFTILGLSRHGTPFEVREAAERLLAEFDAGRFHGLREPGLPEKLEEVRRVIAEARDVLADDALRAEYVEALGIG